MIKKVQQSKRPIHFHLSERAFIARWPRCSFDHRVFPPCPNMINYLSLSVFLPSVAEVSRCGLVLATIGSRRSGRLESSDGDGGDLFCSHTAKHRRLESSGIHFFCSFSLPEKNLLQLNVINVFNTRQQSSSSSSSETYTHNFSLTTREEEVEC